MKKIIIGLAVFVAAGAGFLVMNNSSSKDEVSTGDAKSATQSVADNSTSSTVTSTNTVSIKNTAFSPSKITVKKGTTVTWTNNDSTSHTVTSDSGDTMKSATLANGDTYSVTFNEVGTFSYHCSFHGTMIGSVTVTE